MVIKIFNDEEDKWEVIGHSDAILIERDAHNALKILDINDGFHLRNFKGGGEPLSITPKDITAIIIN